MVFVLVSHASSSVSVIVMMRGRRAMVFVKTTARCIGAVIAFFGCWLGRSMMRSSVTMSVRTTASSATVLLLPWSTAPELLVSLERIKECGFFSCCSVLGSKGESIGSIARVILQAGDKVPEVVVALIHIVVVVIVVVA